MVELRGHYAYYGITFNFQSLERFFLRIREIWFKWLKPAVGQEQSVLVAVP
jgi:hypothetical protein